MKIVVWGMEIQMDSTAVLFFVLVIFLFWISIWVPATMAAERGRSVFGWLLLTLFFSPMITIIALLVLGPTVEKALERMHRR
ncbi:hypothetical protein [Rhodobacter xanthinilyticus]|nr:hypothetical protein [Rhodobacter xanthinilyticus]